MLLPPPPTATLKLGCAEHKCKSSADPGSTGSCSVKCTRLPCTELAGLGAGRSIAAVQHFRPLLVLVSKLSSVIGGCSAINCRAVVRSCAHLKRHARVLWWQSCISHIWAIDHIPSARCTAAVAVLNGLSQDAGCPGGGEASLEVRLRCLSRTVAAKGSGKPGAGDIGCLADCRGPDASDIGRGKCRKDSYVAVRGNPVEHPAPSDACERASLAAQAGLLKIWETGRLPLLQLLRSAVRTIC